MRPAIAQHLISSVQGDYYHVRTKACMFRLMFDISWIQLRAVGRFTTFWLVDSCSSAIASLASLDKAFHSSASVACTSMRRTTLPSVQLLDKIDNCNDGTHTCSHFCHSFTFECIEPIHFFMARGKSGTRLEEEVKKIAGCLVEPVRKFLGL